MVKKIINESQLKQIVAESVKRVIEESLKGKGAQKILKLASEHGGLVVSHGPWSSSKTKYGLTWGGYLSEIPEDCVLGTGHVDLHTHPHKNFEINGVSDDKLEQIQCKDGTFIYYDREKFKDFIEQDGRQKSRKDNHSVYGNFDGAFKYSGKHTKDIEDKKYGLGGEKSPFRESYDLQIQNIKGTISNLKRLKELGIVTNIQSEADSAIEALEAIITKLEEADKNMIDNLPNGSTDSGHYWRVNQPGNVTKTMKSRDSSIPNRHGFTGGSKDVQMQGKWYRDGHSDYAHKGKYPYR